MEVQLRLEEEDVFANQGAYPIPALSTSTSIFCPSSPRADQLRHTLRGTCHTSNTVSSDTSHQAINPVGVLLRFAHDNGVALLENFVDRDERLERLDLVGEDRLPATRKHTSQSYTPADIPYSSTSSAPQNTYTFMPAQKAADDLWSHVYTMQLRTCLPTTIKENQLNRTWTNSGATLSPRNPIDDAMGGRTFRCGFLYRKTNS